MYTQLLMFYFGWSQCPGTITVVLCCLTSLSLVSLASLSCKIFAIVFWLNVFKTLGFHTLEFSGCYYWQRIWIFGQVHMIIDYKMMINFSKFIIECSLLLSFKSHNFQWGKKKRQDYLHQFDFNLWYFCQ